MTPRRAKKEADWLVFVGQKDKTPGPAGAGAWREGTRQGRMLTLNAAP
jgi:hypothetical protein